MREEKGKWEGEGREIEYEESRITEKIIWCIINVHKELGPGFLESIYRKALMIELALAGLPAETEKEVQVIYREDEVGLHRLDVLVGKEVVLELKSVEEISWKHYAQLRSYLKAAGLNLGLLVNFNKEKADIRRVSRSCGGSQQ